MTSGLGVFDTTFQHTNLSLKDLVEQLGVGRRHAYEVLSATLHAVRDRITPEKAVHLGSQLPMLMRGLHYEAWYSAGTPTRPRQTEDFLDYVSGDVFCGLGIDPRTRRPHGAKRHVEPARCRRDQEARQVVPGGDARAVAGDGAGAAHSGEPPGSRHEPHPREVLKP
jgi:uncharacterized protein (DUF2267 family)